MRQIRPAQWLPLVEVAPRAGYWLMAWASFWAAETSLPQTLHQQRPSSGTSCLTGLTRICQRKETVTKFLPCSLKKKLQGLFFGSHTQSPDWKSPVGDKTHLCCGKIVVTIGEGWWKGHRGFDGLVRSLSPPACWWRGCAVGGNTSSSTYRHFPVCMLRVWTKIWK